MAHYISDIIKKLCLQKPIAPVFDKIEEWFPVDDNLWQHKRCSSLFKRDGEPPYYLDAIIWQGEQYWDTFTGAVRKDTVDFEIISSFQYVVFPFIPKSFYVDVINVPVSLDEIKEKNLNAHQGRDGSYFIRVVKNPADLKAVFDYYKFRR